MFVNKNDLFVETLNEYLPFCRGWLDQVLLCSVERLHAHQEEQPEAYIARHAKSLLELIDKNLRLCSPAQKKTGKATCLLFSLPAEIKFYICSFLQPQHLLRYPCCRYVFDSIMLRLGVTCKCSYCFTSDPGLWKTTVDKHSWICEKSKRRVLRMYAGRDLFPPKKEPRTALATSQTISHKVKAKREVVQTRNRWRNAGKRPKQKWNSKKRQLQFRH